MARRTNSFAKALADAQKRLEKAQAERTAAQARLVQLNVEIPTLERVIWSLTQHESPKEVRFDSRPYVPGFEPPPKNLSPEEIAKWYSDRDLSNVGSLVPVRPATPEPTEDELLPDDFAVGKKE